jgi:pteridine reductase
MNSKPLTFSKPTAFVTGGAKRVGREICLQLAKNGYDIYFTFHSSAKEAALLADEIKSISPTAQAMSFKCDLSKLSDTKKLIIKLKKNLNRLDLLLNNASSYEPGTLQEISDEHMLKHFSIHSISPTLLVQGLAPLLKKSRGSVINMLDIQAEKPSKKYQAYCSSKAALWNLTLTWAKELAPEVTVNGIAPGVVDWPADMTEAQRRAYLKNVPLGRAGKPEDVAGLVHFLATQGKYITGQIIRLDGGRSIQW